MKAIDPLNFFMKKLNTNQISNHNIGEEDYQSVYIYIHTTTYFDFNQSSIASEIAFVRLPFFMP